MVKLMESLSDEIAAELTPMFERGERSADEAFALGLGNLVEAASRYAPLVVAVSEEWPAIPELKQIWFAMLGDFTTRLARMIESERAAGAAPEGADPRALAASLVWTAERAFHVAVGGDHPTLVDASDGGGAADAAVRGDDLRAGGGGGVAGGPRLSWARPGQTACLDGGRTNRGLCRGCG